MKKSKKSPIKENPLRYPGQSLEEEIKRVLDDEASQYIIIPLFAIVLAGTEWWRWYSNSSFFPILYTVVALIALFFSIYKIIKIKEKLSNLKLGRDGERVIGQFLEHFREEGFKVFHDVVGKNEEEYNIDHVIIGKKGIFTIETKAYSKNIKGKSIIKFDGEKIYINGSESKKDIVGQARAESKWLTEILKKLTEKTFYVKPVVLFPGWYIKNVANKKTDLWVLNPNALRAFILNSPDIYSNEEVLSIANKLSRHIRKPIK